MVEVVEVVAGVAAAVEISIDDPEVHDHRLGDGVLVAIEGLLQGGN